MLQDTLNREIAKACARNVAYSAELAREFGFAVPDELEFGFAAALRTATGHVYEYQARLRLFDVTHRFVFSGKSEDAGEFVEQCRREAANMVSRYIDAHPEIEPSPEQAVEIRDRIKSTEVGGEMDQRAMERARRAVLSVQ